MQKKILIWLLFALFLPSSLHANGEEIRQSWIAPKPINEKTELILGPFKIGDSFDRELACRHLGSVTSVRKEKYPHSKTEGPTTVTFEKGFIETRQGKIQTVGIWTEGISTPRGISVGCSFFMLTKTYGLPRKRESLRSSKWRPAVFVKQSNGTYRCGYSGQGEDAEVLQVYLNEDGRIRMLQISG